MVPIIINESVSIKYCMRNYSLLYIKQNDMYVWLSVHAQKPS